MDGYFVKLCFILGQNDDSKSHWIKKASLVDSRTSVTDVKFGPRHLGLLLATCSADGTVRIYEAPDVMNLSQWSLQHEIQCNLPCRYVVHTSYIHFFFHERLYHFRRSCFEYAYLSGFGEFKHYCEK